MKQLIKKLTETISPSGSEGAIREVILNEIEPLVDEIRIDSMGNIITRKGEKSVAGKRVMITAHMDEIGLIVKNIDKNGFIRFTPIGIPLTPYLPGERVRFINGAKGVIGIEDLAKLNEIPKLEKMFIDVGATENQDCPVKVGDVATFDQPFIEAGGRLVAKSLDDRVGVAIVIETIRKVKVGVHEFFFVFTVQEEVGARGATVSAYDVDPEIGISIDITPAGDTPNQKQGNIELGLGPAITIMDHLMVSDPRIVKYMERTAQREKIPIQRLVYDSGSSDTRAIQLTRSGVIAGGLAVPCRYVHSPSEMVDYDDVENAVKLLIALLNAPIEVG